VQETVRK